MEGPAARPLCHAPDPAAARARPAIAAAIAGWVMGILGAVAVAVATAQPRQNLWVASSTAPAWTVSHPVTSGRAGHQLHAFQVSATAASSAAAPVVPHRTASPGGAGLPLRPVAVGGVLVAGAAAAAGYALGRRGSPRTVLRHHGEPASGEPVAPALLLDCDGTIVDTERDGHRVAFNQAFAKKGLKWVQWGVMLYGELLTTGGGKERMTRYFTDYAPELWPDAEQPPSPKHPLIVDLHLLKTQLFMDIIESGSLPLRPGIKSLVEDALAAGWKVAVCSTSNEKAVQSVVDKLLDSKIKHIFAGDVVAKKKPDPAIYNLAARELGLDPAHCVVVEDSGIGLEAARAAGMKCVVTKSTYTAAEDFTGAQVVLDDLRHFDFAKVAALL
eukprot:EG_transcript_15382